ncbi:MAG: hypothetical protein AAF940_15170 [Pseudomonadota bacterium]
MAELKPRTGDWDAFVFAQTKMRAGIDVALLTVTGSDDVGVPVGAVCALSADGETGGVQHWSRAVIAHAESVLSRGDPVTIDLDGVRVLIVRIG